MAHPKHNATSFKPGQSGNPKGRPKKVIDLLELARADVPEAFELARKLMRDEDVDPKLRLDAGKFLTSYGIGAPPKSAVVVDEDDEVQTSAGLDTATALRVLQVVRVKLKVGDESDD